MGRVARRSFLAIGVSAFTAVVNGRFARPALAANNDADALIRKFTGGKPVDESRVRLDLPEIAENGNTVPMTVAV